MLTVLAAGVAGEATTGMLNSVEAVFETGPAGPVGPVAPVAPVVPVAPAGIPKLNTAAEVLPVLVTVGEARGSSCGNCSGCSC